MTATMVRTDTPSEWGSMPGWGVVADMIPPELTNLRWIGVLRRRIVFVLVLVVALCAGAYIYESMQNSNASDAAAQATMQTNELQHAASKYAAITRIETTVDGVRAQVATVMQDDVDVAGLLLKVRLALPNTMSIQNVALALTSASAAAATPPGLDASGHAEVGKVSVTGSARTLDDLPAFVDRVAAIPGVVNVLPGTNQLSSGFAQFTLTFALTDQLYSHRYDVANTGVK